MRRPSGLSIGGTWGQWRSRGGENKIWRIQTLFFPLVWLWCVSKWKWGQCCHHFYFLLFTFFASLLCSSLLWNATDEGAIAPKALVYVQINVKFNLVGSVWWIREELSRVSCFLAPRLRTLDPDVEHFNLLKWKEQNVWKSCYVRSPLQAMTIELVPIQTAGQINQSHCRSPH